ncbi:four helix bundle protein [Ohtaekwangia sp.]|uniref:four helix bundle protein n=1 Tax=Ohtaekwangia sp. TaxID=2066019 RepID=UPI002F923BF1
MASIRSFEEIEAWQKARVLADRIYALSLKGSFYTDYKLRDQITGASGSIMDNIAEGFERNGNREFVQFLSIAKGSAGEVRSQLYRAFDRHHISPEIFQELKEQVLLITKLISGLITYLNQSTYKGTKYVREPEEVYTTSNYKMLNLESTNLEP